MTGMAFDGPGRLGYVFHGRVVEAIRLFTYSGETPMNPDQNNFPHGANYISLVFDVWPLILGAFLIALFRGWSGVKRSYLRRGHLATFCNIVLNSAIAAVAAVAFTWALPVFGVQLDESSQLGLTICLAAGGMQYAEEWICRLMGVSRVNPKKEEDLQYMKSTMTAEQRKKHYAMCPFRDECSHAHCQEDRTNGKQTSDL